MLSIFITESLEESNECITYFFCRHDDEKRNTETAVLRGLLVQLLRTISDQAFDQHVWPSFHSDKAASYTLSGPQTIWNVFQALLTSRDSTTTFCILDGLDECNRDTSRQLTQRFHDIFETNKSAHSTVTFKLAVVRRDPSGFCGFSNIQLEECDLHIRHDIDLFIARNIQDALSHKPGFDKRVLRWISDRLRYRSEGSFLWISFVVRDLSRYRTSREVMKTLEHTPMGLQEQYRRILRQIFEEHEDDWRHIQALLAWVSLAFMPLTMPQLASAVMGSSSRQNREHISDLLRFCEHLLVVSEKSRVVRLVHTSAKEFLVQPHSANPTVSVTERTHVDDGHRTITTKCLKILEQTSESDVLKPYAIKFLPQHMKACKAADVSRELSRPFFTAGDILQSQWEGWRLPQSDSRLFPEATPSPLHIATYWGILPWAQQQLEARSRVLDIVLRRSWLETKDEGGMTPLAIAVQNEDLPMVEWLLQQGAIVHLEMADAEDVHRYSYVRSASPLVIAFWHDEVFNTLERWLESQPKKMASLLLSFLHKPTWRSIRQSNALMAACENKYDTEAQWLLSSFPPPKKSTRTHFKCPPLRQAVRSFHVRISEQLLDCGADIYSSWPPGYTALTDLLINADEDDTAICKTMLNLLFDEYDKRISTSGLGNKRDLLLQPIEGSLDRLPFLELNNFRSKELFPFFEAECKEQEGKLNALVAAAYHGVGLGLCLRRGNFGRFSDPGYSGRFELMAAVISGSIQSIVTLLQNGVNVDTVDRHGNSVLTLATRYGIWDVVATLLSHGAEVNSIGDAGTTPLVEAVREQVMIYQKYYLLDRPGRASSVSSIFRKKKLAIVSKLLKSGASTYQRTSAGDTALSLAANLGDAGTVSILVERGTRMAIEDQILDRGLWQWFVVFKLLKMRGKLSNRFCSKLLAARLLLLAKGRSRPEWPDVYVHFEEDVDAAVYTRSDMRGLRPAKVHMW